MPSEQKDWWDKVDIIAKTVTALLVPFISIAAAYLVNSSNELVNNRNEVDRHQLQTQRQKQISDLLVKLAEQKATVI